MGRTDRQYQPEVGAGMDRMGVSLVVDSFCWLAIVFKIRVIESVIA